MLAVSIKHWKGRSGGALGRGTPLCLDPSYQTSFVSRSNTSLAYTPKEAISHTLFC